MPTLTLPRSLTALAVLALLAGAGLLLLPSAPRADTPAPTAAPRPALTVQVVQPQAMLVEQRLAAHGNVAAWQEASVGAEVSGLRLSEVRVNVGDSVRAGQVLATLAPETVQAELAQARASLQEARALLAEAQGNAARTQALAPAGALSQQQVEQYASAALVAQARVESAQALLEMQQLRLRRTQVLAPDSGVISARSATVGAVVGQGTELFRLLRRNRLEWRAEVSAAELAQLRPGLPVQLTMASGAPVTGQVRVLAPTVDPGSRNALVYVDLPPHPELRAGMFVRGELLLGQRQGLMLPQSAIVVRDGFSSVFAVAADGRVSLQRVRLGQRVGQQVDILEGVTPQARIVAQGAAFLSDGDRVRVLSESEVKTVNPGVSRGDAAIK